MSPDNHLARLAHWFCSEERNEIYSNSTAQTVLYLPVAKDEQSILPLR